MKFTVLIPTFNNGVVIRSAIESVLEQSVTGFELFIVCDGSPPETHAVVDKYAARDKRVRVFKFEKGERHGEAWRHQALKEASGEAVCYLSDDDFWFPDHLAVMRDLLAEADFANTRHVKMTQDFRAIGLVDDLGDPATRERMLTSTHNFFGLSAPGHRLDAYRRLPEGWSPAPAGLQTDLYMWRKWISAPNMRLRSSMAVTSLHFPRSERRDQTRNPAYEIDFWREAFRERHMREALRALIPPTKQPIPLASVAARAAALREEEMEAQENMLRAVLNSRTWRYTQPLRDLLTWARGRKR